MKNESQSQIPNETPLVLGTATTTPRSLQRAVSAERRRSPLSSAEKLLVTPARSLSVSFQGESENSKPTGQQQLQQHRWPGRLRVENSSLLARSLDHGSEKAKWSGSGHVLREVRKSVVDETSMRKSVTELKLKNNIEETRGTSEVGRRLQKPLNSDVGSIHTIQLGKRVHKAPEPASPLSNGTLGPSKFTLQKKFPNSSPVSSPRELYPSRGLSPVRTSVRAASPCRALSSSTGAVLRGIASPSMVRSKTVSSMNGDNTCCTPSALSYATDVRRGKLGENRIADAHGLMLLHNRLLQWRLANAKVENTMLVQRYTAERSLYDACMTTFKLRHSVISKEIELQLLRRSHKLYSILKKQEPHLENWNLLDQDHHRSVSDAIKALEAGTIRLPVCGARAEVLKVQEAITSAVDVMQAMASSVCSLQVKVEQMNLLVSELSKLSAQEHCLLEEYTDLFSRTFIPLQVTECSLRSHILQADDKKLGKESPTA
ncbi:QWRF motif-containing protein 2 [Striga hermonthica]|uniref:QWRF motif-containing protein 2 n=1 Tax=Striga hermonthica TaxID=68872 RepID=A0A9N7P331_STRHE|nr:QWRF motif-containing protein 2 [Striga hermonthica]